MSRCARTDAVLTQHPVSDEREPEPSPLPFGAHTGVECVRLAGKRRDALRLLRGGDLNIFAQEFERSCESGAGITSEGRRRGSPTGPALRTGRGLSSSVHEGDPRRRRGMAMAPIAARTFAGGGACRQMRGGPPPSPRASTAVSTESSASMKSIRTPSTCRKMTTVARAGASDAIPQTPATWVEEGEPRTSPAPGVSERAAAGATTTQKLVT